MSEHRIVFMPKRFKTRVTVMFGLNWFQAAPIFLYGFFIIFLLMLVTNGLVPKPPGWLVITLIVIPCIYLMLLMQMKMRLTTIEYLSLAIDFIKQEKVLRIKKEEVDFYAWSKINGMDEVEFKQLLELPYKTRLKKASVLKKKKQISEHQYDLLIKKENND